MLPRVERLLDVTGYDPTCLVPLDGSLSELCECVHVVRRVVTWSGVCLVEIGVHLTWVVDD